MIARNIHEPTHAQLVVNGAVAVSMGEPKEADMRFKKSGLWISMVLAVVTVSALGCASRSTGVPRTIGANDLSSLAGTWAGTMTLPSGNITRGTMEIAPTGEYVTRAGAFSAAGKAQVRNGNLVLVPAMTSGAGGAVTGARTSVASLTERPDGALVLTGTGHSEAGPFNFEVTRLR